MSRRWRRRRWGNSTRHGRHVVASVWLDVDKLVEIHRWRRWWWHTRISRRRRRRPRATDAWGRGRRRRAVVVAMAATPLPTEAEAVVVVRVRVALRRGGRAGCMSGMGTGRTVAMAVASARRMGREWRRRGARGRRVRPELEAWYSLLPQRGAPTDSGAYAVHDLAIRTTHFGEGGDYVCHVVCELYGCASVALRPSVTTRGVVGCGWGGGPGSGGAIAGVA